MNFDVVLVFCVFLEIFESCFLGIWVLCMVLGIVFKDLMMVVFVGLGFY